MNNLTPKEKALELCEKFKTIDWTEVRRLSIDEETTIDHAIKCTEEVINDSWDKSKSERDLYWKQVIKENK